MSNSFNERGNLLLLTISNYLRYNYVTCNIHGRAKRYTCYLNTKTVVTTIVLHSFLTYLLPAICTLVLSLGQSDDLLHLRISTIEQRHISWNISYFSSPDTPATT